MDIREVFARNLRWVRHENGYSQEALALEAGVDRTYVSALERGVHSASIDMVDKLAGVLGVETDTLLHRPAKAGRNKPYRPASIPARNRLKPATSASNKAHAIVRRRSG